MKFKEKQTFYKKNDRRKYHIVKIFEDDDRKLVVIKYFGLHKQWWHYEIYDMFNFKDRFNYGIYSEKRHENK